MHPPERGFGRPPRSQQPDQTGMGSRPLLQGHLKPNRKRHPQAPFKAPTAPAAEVSKPPVAKTTPVPKRASARLKPAEE